LSIFAILSLVVLVCGQSAQSVEGTLGSEGGILKDEEIEFNANKDAIPRGEAVSITMSKTGDLPLPDGYHSGNRSITIRPETIVFDDPCELRVKVSGPGYRLALRVPDGAVVLAEGRQKGDWISAEITHGGTYVPVKPPERSGVSVPRFGDEALLLIGDIYLSDYFEKTETYLRSEGFDLPVWTFTYPSWESIEDNAQLLSRELEGLHDEHGEFSLDVVAFGTGGLILHKYVVDTALYKRDVGKAVIGVGVPYFGTALAARETAGSAGEPWAFAFVDAMGENADDLLPGSELTKWIRATRHKAMKNTFKPDEISGNRNTVSLAGLSGFEGDLPELTDGDGWVSRANTMLTYIEPEPFEADHFELMRDKEMLATLKGFLDLYREGSWPELFSAVWRGDRSFSAIVDSWEREVKLTLRSDENFDMLVNYNANMLRSVPENGFLLTNGDYDTYPAWYAQKALGVREDVLILNRSLLNVDHFVLHLKSKGLPLEWTTEEIRALKARRDDDGTLHLPADSIVRTLSRDHRDRLRLAVTVYNPEAYGYPLKLQGLVHALEEGEIDVQRTRELLHEEYDFDPFPGFSTTALSGSLRGLLLNYVAAMWKLSGTLKEEGRLEQALEEATFAKRTLPEEPWGYMMEGDVYKEMGRLRNAESSYKTAVQLGPAVFQAHETLAEFYAETDERSKAIGVIAAWVAEHPDDEVALELLSRYTEEKKE
jgi:tetratricopeptide (TPR) repeat protein